MSTRVMFHLLADQIHDLGSRLMGSTWVANAAAAFPWATIVANAAIPDVPLVPPAAAGSAVTILLALIGTLSLWLRLKYGDKAAERLASDKIRQAADEAVEKIRRAEMAAAEKVRQAEAIAHEERIKGLTAELEAVRDHADWLERSRETATIDAHPGASPHAPTDPRAGQGRDPETPASRREPAVDLGGAAGQPRDGAEAGPEGGRAEGPTPHQDVLITPTAEDLRRLYARQPSDPY